MNTHAQIHKIMAGLLDVHTLAGSGLALQMVIDEASCFTRYIDAAVAANGTKHWHDMLKNEFGGMQEVAANLYAVTRDPEHLRCVRAHVPCARRVPRVCV